MKWQPEYKIGDFWPRMPYALSHATSVETAVVSAVLLSTFLDHFGVWENHYDIGALQMPIISPTPFVFVWAVVSIGIFLGTCKKCYLCRKVTELEITSQVYYDIKALFE